ncbi:MAG: ribosome biogenesis GTP-binding protein YihA/YsxC [Bacillota bacterium]|jgi:GTP-binding protein|nr:ribosome biogenesis GTP-binding protein YihA/YsxC [Bacillota bacterium]NLM08276.1 YihA family ribosome biogenesis GTP-binding protein [Clostridiales Family XIII bacterium]
MIIKEAELAAVAVNPEQYPDTSKKEIAIAGRSNVGKSSLINMLLNRRGLARVSGSPGKTRTINFYDVNKDFRIVDLPGYGYAKVSRSTIDNWGKMIDNYLSNRPNLVKMIQLVDVRHPPTAQDIQMYEWMRYYGLDGLVVGTKADKVSKAELARNLNVIRKTLGLSERDKIIPVSALKRTGYEELLKALDEILKEG